MGSVSVRSGNPKAYGSQMQGERWSLPPVVGPVESANAGS